MAEEKTGEPNDTVEKKPFEGIQEAIADKLGQLREGFRSGEISADEVADLAERLSKQSEILGKLAKGEPIDEKRPKT